MPTLSEAEAQSIAATLTRDAKQPPTTRDLLNRKALLLLFVAHLGDELATIEAQLPPDHRTQRPSSSGATPTMSQPETTPRLQENAPATPPHATATRESRPTDNGTPAAALTLPAPDHTIRTAEQNDRQSVLSAAAAENGLCSTVDAAAAASLILRSPVTAADPAADAAAVSDRTDSASAAAAAAVRPSDPEPDRTAAAAGVLIAGSLMSDASVANAIIPPAAATPTTANPAAAAAPPVISHPLTAEASDAADERADDAAAASPLNARSSALLTAAAAAAVRLTVTSAA